MTKEQRLAKLKAETERLIDQDLYAWETALRKRMGLPPVIPESRHAVMLSHEDTVGHLHLTREGWT